MILQGGRKWDGLAVNGDAGHPSTQATANKLVTRTTPMQVTGLSHPSFSPTYKLRLARGHAIFSHQGRGDRDVIVMTGGAQTPHTPRTKSDMQAVPTGMISVTLHFKKRTRCPPSASRVEVTNDNAQCTKCINVYSKFFGMLKVRLHDYKI